MYDGQRDYIVTRMTVGFGLKYGRPM
jgi:hypothetical protein